jgi:hypothetical protein
MKPNRGTATAQPTRPTGGRHDVGGAARGHLHRGVRPCSYPDRRHRFRRRLQPYGMQTVHPYLGAVKIVALHIVD